MHPTGEGRQLWWRGEVQQFQPMQNGCGWSLNLSWHETAGQGGLAGRCYPGPEWGRKKEREMLLARVKGRSGSARPRRASLCTMQQPSPTFKGDTGLQAQIGGGAGRSNPRGHRMDHIKYVVWSLHWSLLRARQRHTTVVCALKGMCVVAGQAQGTGHF